LDPKLQLKKAPIGENRAPETGPEIRTMAQEGHIIVHAKDVTGTIHGGAAGPM